jgi:hypothetical protein
LKKRKRRVRREREGKNVAMREKWQAGAVVAKNFIKYI